MHIITKELKSLKYEGVVELKIFWSLRRLETGLSGFKLKRVHYGKLGLQITKNHPYFPQPNTPLLPFPLKFSVSFSSPLWNARRPSLPLHHFSSSSHLTNRPLLLKSFLISVSHLFSFINQCKSRLIGGCLWRTGGAIFWRRRVPFPAADGGERYGTHVLSFSWVFFWFQLHFLIFLSFLSH